MSWSHNYAPNHVNENLRDQVVNSWLTRGLFAVGQSQDIGLRNWKLRVYMPGVSFAKYQVSGKDGDVNSIVYKVVQVSFLLLISSIDESRELEIAIGRTINGHREG